MPTLQFTYNGDGQRVQTVESGVTKKQVWDEENILLETDGAGVTQVVYTQEPAGYGNLVSQRRGSSTSYYLFDALGSTRRLSNSGGSATDTYEYRAFGELYSSSGSTINVFRWVGQVGYYYDVDREAYYVRARHYSPKQGRWISQDPIGFSGSEWNLYEYGNSTPTTAIDPTGAAWSWNPFDWFCKKKAPPTPPWPVRQCDNACDTAYPVKPGVGGGLQNRLCKEMCRAGYDLFQSGFNSSFCDGLNQRCAVIAADPCDKRKDLKYGICITLVEALCEGNAGGGPG